MQPERDSAPVTTAVILAGGLGTRLRKAAPDVPKAMAPIGGRPFLEHQLDFWIAAGITRFVLSVGYRREVIIEHFGEEYRGARIDYAVEETPLGTGGGLLRAVKALDENTPFLLLNGDTFFDVSLADFFRFHTQKAADLSVALFRAPDADRYGLADLDADQRVSALASVTAQTGQLANGGVYCLTAKVLRHWLDKSERKISFEMDILPEMLSRGMRLFGMESPGRFIDIGAPDDYRRALTIIYKP